MPSAKNMGIETGKLKIIVVGDTGTGKSRFASTAPTPGFLFDIGGEVLSYRGKDWDYETFDISPKGLAKLNFVIQEIINQTYHPDDINNTKGRKPGEGKSYKTIILDNTTALSQMAMSHCLQINPDTDDVGGPKFEIHYGMAVTVVLGKLRQFISKGDCIRIVIAHTDLVKDKKGNVIGANPLLGGKLTTIIPGWFDEVLYARTKTVEGKVEYWLQTRNSGLYPARSRISGEEGLLPDYIPNHFDSLTKENTHE